MGGVLAVFLYEITGAAEGADHAGLVGCVTAMKVFFGEGVVFVSLPDAGAGGAVRSLGIVGDVRAAAQAMALGRFGNRGRAVAFV